MLFAAIGALLYGFAAGALAALPDWFLRRRPPSAVGAVSSVVILTAVVSATFGCLALFSGVSAVLPVVRVGMAHARGGRGRRPPRARSVARHRRRERRAAVTSLERDPPDGRRRASRPSPDGRRSGPAAPDATRLTDAAPAAARGSVRSWGTTTVRSAAAPRSSRRRVRRLGAWSSSPPDSERVPSPDLTGARWSPTVAPPAHQPSCRPRRRHPATNEPQPPGARAAQHVDTTWVLVVLAVVVVALLVLVVVHLLRKRRRRGRPEEIGVAGLTVAVAAEPSAESADSTPPRDRPCARGAVRTTRPVRRRHRCVARSAGVRRGRRVPSGAAETPTEFTTRISDDSTSTRPPSRPCVAATSRCVSAGVRRATPTSPPSAPHCARSTHSGPTPRRADREPPPHTGVLVLAVVAAAITWFFGVGVLQSLAVGGAVAAVGLTGARSARTSR